MLIFGYLNTFPNTFWGDGIWYFLRSQDVFVFTEFYLGTANNDKSISD